MRALVERGQLALGPWYVLADEILAGDEPLVRNLLIGRHRGARLGGWLPVGYSPDAFGHPDALPTILAGFGIDDAILWRGRGGPTDLFRWRGPDGATVLVYHLPPPGYEYGAELPTAAAEARVRWRALAALLAPRARVPVLLVMNGADHHAMQPDLRQAARALRRASDADVRIGTPADYFDAARKALALDGVGVPEVGGELRWSPGHTWSLPGVTATRTALKQRIAESASLLTRWAEPQAALAPGAADHGARLALAWRHHLANLTHDVLAGTVSDVVAEDAHVRARQVSEQARGVLVDALDGRLGQDPVRRRRDRTSREPSLVLVNPSPCRRAGTLEATVTVPNREVVVGRAAPEPAPAPLAPFHLTDPGGRIVPMQVLSVGEAWERFDSPRDYPESAGVWAVRVAVNAGPVPPFGLTRLTVRTGAAPARRETPDRVAAASGALRAPWGTATPRPTGLRVRARSGETCMLSLVSERDDGDTYTIQPVPGDRPVRPGWRRPRAVWSGPLLAAHARDFRLGRRAHGTMYARADAGSGLLRIVVTGTNRAGGHRLRFVLTPSEPVTRTIADMAYGAVARPVAPPAPEPYPAEQPAATAPMHRFVGTDRWTVFARGLHEYEVLPDGALAVTLLRAVGDLSLGTLAARPGHAGWPTATPGAQGLGAFRAELAIARVGVGDRPRPAVWAEVDALADEFHAPLAAYMCRAGVQVPGEVRGPELRGTGLSFRALKPREEGPGVVARCVNLTPRARAGRWIWPTGVSRAFRSRLDETPVQELPLTGDRRTIAFDAAPREVVTIIVEP